MDLESDTMPSLYRALRNEKETEVLRAAERSRPRPRIIPSMARVKGRLLVTARDFVLAGHGELGWGRVLENVPPADRDQLASMVSIGWYDIGLNDRLNRAIVGAHGSGALEVMSALGRYSAGEDLTTIHRVFLRMASPAFVLERVAEFWGRYQDSGVWSIVREEPNRVRATLEGWGSEDEASCVRLVGYTHRLFELVGAKGVFLERRACRARGDASCVFVGGWA